MCADDPKFLGVNPEGFAERNFGYPLLYVVPRSGMEYGSGGYPRTLFAMERSGIANNIRDIQSFSGTEWKKNLGEARAEG